MPNTKTIFRKPKYIQPALKRLNRNRLFVMVSDAFRYEAAEEFEQIINGKYRMKAELKSMLGVLPSYTALGMAALLPHKNCLSGINHPMFWLMKSLQTLWITVIKYYHGMKVLRSNLKTWQPWAEIRGVNLLSLIELYLPQPDWCGWKQSVYRKPNIWCWFVRSP